MKPYYDKDGITIYHGNCLDILPRLEPENIDTVITDSPYGLEFMGKEWDHGVPGIQFWEAIMRVVKPGAFMLAFGGTRTYHRLTCAIEDAGWEIRDCVMWIYGSGFPKSLDIGKAIDKAAGAKREVVGDKLDLPGYHLSGHNGGQAFGHGLSSSTPETRAKSAELTAPATPAAEEWEGWGTSLKPAYETISVSMKPMPGTFAANALKHGVAGLWIDGARVGTDWEKTPGYRPNYKRHKYSTTVYQGKSFNKSRTEHKQEKYIKGRWPANVILDGSAEVLAGFPDSKSGEETMPPVPRGIWSDVSNTPCGPQYGDTGTAARFFYCAKTSKAERGAYNDHPTVKPLALLRYLCKLTKTPTGGTIIDPFMGSGSLLLAAKLEGRPVIGIDQDGHSCEIAVRRIEEYLTDGYSEEIRTSKVAINKKLF